MLGNEDINQAGFGSLFESRGGAGPEFESPQALYEKLQKAEREKRKIRDELESAADRWAAERRRLHSDIDELRRTADRMREQVDHAEQIQRRFEETRRYSRQLEIQCEEHAVHFEAEQRRYQSKIEDLEKQVVELIDRSGNVRRAEQELERRMEEQVAAEKRRIEIEAERRLQTLEIERKKERSVLEIEIERLKRKLAALPPAKTAAAPPRSSSFLERLRIGRR